MNCPSCGRPMQPGHITGTSLMRIIPEDGTIRNTHKPSEENTEDACRAIPGPGYLLDVPYSGMAPWVPAWYCLPCRKVTGVLDILNCTKEGTK